MEFLLWQVKISTYSRVPNNRGVRITVLVGKILESNNRVGPNNSVGRKKILKSNYSVGPNNRVGGKN